MGKRSKYKGLEEARKQGKQKKPGHGKRTKKAIPDYRSSNYSETHQDVTLVDGTVHRERVAYARKPGNGKRRLYTPDELGELTASQNGHTLINQGSGVVDTGLGSGTASGTSGGTYTQPEYVGAGRRDVPNSEALAYGNGSETLSFENPEPIRPEIPIKDVPWVYREEWRERRKRVEYKDALGNRVAENITVRELVIVDRPERGYWAGGLRGRATDKRNLTADLKHNRGSHKADIGKRMPVPNK